ncbi:MAG: YigZ family protein [Eubacteriales bacterium]|nr:YigZ family protein [Eubacteriales bacterium]
MPEILYTTIAGEGQAECEDRKSVFIGHAMPVKSEEDAVRYIKNIRHKYSDARHNVHAFMIGNGTVSRSNDDGEPSGSAGVPVLEVIRKSGITDVCIVVTRYFGGILLGTGGLVRAYSAAAKAAIENAGVVTYEQYTVMRLNCGYSEYQKISNELARVGAIIDSTDFDAAVTVVFAVKSGVADGICNVIRELSAGKTIPEKISVRFDFR